MRLGRRGAGQRAGHRPRRRRPPGPAAPARAARGGLGAGHAAGRATPARSRRPPAGRAAPADRAGHGRRAPLVTVGGRGAHRRSPAGGGCSSLGVGAHWCSASRSGSAATPRSATPPARAPSPCAAAGWSASRRCCSAGPSSAGRCGSRSSSAGPGWPPSRPASAPAAAATSPSTWPPTRSPRSPRAASGALGPRPRSALTGPVGGRRYGRRPPRGAAMDVDTNQPLGTPTWIDLAVPDLDAALAFYGAVFGWDFRTGPEEHGRYTNCLLRGRRVAGDLADGGAGRRRAGPSTWPRRTVDATARARALRRAAPCWTSRPTPDQGRWAVVRDPVGARFGLWQGRDHVGSQVVNEPGALVRNDLVTPTPTGPRGSTRRSSTSPSTATRTCRASTSPSCAVPTGTRWAASWACPGDDVGVEHHVRGRRHRRGRAAARSTRGGTSSGGGGLRLRPDRHDHRSVRRRVHRHHPAAGTDLRRVRSQLPSEPGGRVRGARPASRPAAAST